MFVGNQIIFLLQNSSSLYLMIILLPNGHSLALYLDCFRRNDFDLILFFLGLKKFFNSLFSKRDSAGWATLQYYLFIPKILPILLHFAFQAIAGCILRGKYDYSITDNIKFLLKNPPNKLSIYRRFKEDLIKVNLPCLLELIFEILERLFREIFLKLFQGKNIL